MIDPALTAEEWAKNEWGDDDDGVSISPGDGAVLIHHRGDYRVYAMVGPKRHATAALCLLGQPYGFDWFDVEVLRTLQGSPNDAIGLLADRIAALLPPKEGT